MISQNRGAANSTQGTRLARDAPTALRPMPRGPGSRGGEDIARHVRGGRLKFSM